MYTQRWADILNRKRAEGDALADDAITAIVGEHDTHKANDIFASLVRNDDIVVAELPERVAQFVSDSAHLPDWADPDQLRAAATVFAEHGLQITMLLLGVSLPVLYAAAPGAHVLTMTQRMTDHLDRRIYETAQFVLDVTAEDAFSPDGFGIRTTQKVRLMHATIRHFIQRHERWYEQWTPEWGVPICQTDLAGTMMSFSVTVTEALVKSGVPLSDAEKDAYLHLWKVVGYILGVHPDLMPESYADGVDMMDTWMQLYHAPTEGGRLLTRVLIEFTQQHLLVLPTLVTDSMRFWVGKHTADMLAVPRYQWTVVVLRLQHVIWWLEEKLERDLPLLGRIGGFAIRRILTGVLLVERGGGRPPFRIPRTLRGSLDLPEK